MTDPLDVLRAAVVPTEPDPAFAARLRARLESALLNPKGVVMTNTEASQPVIVDESAPSEGDLAYSSLLVPDLARASAFYGTVLGWQIEDGSGSDRRIVGVTPPMGLGGDTPAATLFLCHAVDDVEAAVSRIRAAGGQAEEPVERPFGVLADCVDNQGMRLAVLKQPPWATRPTGQPRPGELLYLTVQVPDSKLFRDFYGSVFGWTFTPGRIDDGWGVTGMTPMMGMHGGADRPAVVPMYGVADVTAAVAAVRAAGGTSTEPELMPYGTTADCVDDQGVSFYLGQV
ncbi:MAG TPA: VOC family protein [Pseudonocardiaceae bacterium]|nr:VOC family protein [Pseudonocardiaceae bacterium]